MGVSTKIINKPELFRKLDDIAGKGAKQAFDNTMSDVRKRAPTLIARDVVMRYNIKQGEVKPGGGAASMHITGGISSMTLVYRGRMLTPTHFNMSVTGGKVRKIKATILKGSRVQIGHGGKAYSEGGSRHPRGANTSYMPIHGLPFQREAGSDKPNKVLKVIAVPQMVSSKFIEPAIVHDVTKLAIDRLTRHMQRYLG